MASPGSITSVRAMCLAWGCRIGVRHGAELRTSAQVRAQHQASGITSNTPPQSRCSQHLHHQPSQAVLATTPYRPMSLCKDVQLNVLPGPGTTFETRQTNQDCLPLQG